MNNGASVNLEKSSSSPNHILIHRIRWWRRGLRLDGILPIDPCSGEDATDVRRPTIQSGIYARLRWYLRWIGMVMICSPRSWTTSTTVLISYFRRLLRHSNWWERAIYEQWWWHYLMVVVVERTSSGELSLVFPAYTLTIITSIICTYSPNTDCHISLTLGCDRSFTAFICLAQLHLSGTTYKTHPSQK